MSDTRGERELERAFDRLEEETPDRVTRAIRWLRSPEARWVRLPAGIVLLLLGIVGPFVPVAGIEFLPFAFLLIAQGVPFLRNRPHARSSGVEAVVAEAEGLSCASAGRVVEATRSISAQLDLLPGS